MNRLTARLPGLAFLALGLATWELVSRAGGVKAAFLPPPFAVLETLATLLATGGIIEPLGETLYRLFAGYFVAVALAVIVGLLMGYFRAVENLLEPLVELLRPIPKPALVPPLILFLGFGDLMKMVVVGLGVFFPVLINTVQGVRGVDPVLIQTGRTLGASAPRILWKIVMPATLPHILAGMHISLGIGLILVVLAEFISSESGLGFAIINMQRSFRVREMYAWVIVLAVTGYALNAIFLALRDRLLHWYQGYEAMQRAAAAPEPQAVEG